MENTKEGYVYALINPAMPGYVKIGMTTRSIDERIKELSSSTGVPHKYICVYYIKVNDCYLVEKKLHSLFKNERATNNREFFIINLNTVIDTMVDIKNNDLYKIKKYVINRFNKNENKKITSKFNKYGLNEETQSIYDKNGFNKYGYDIYGFNKLGFRENGYNREGYDKNGFNKVGLDKNGNKK